VTIISGPAAELSFPPTGNTLLSYMVRWRKTANTDWLVAGPLENNAESFETPTLTALTEYEFQLAVRTQKGRVGAYSASTIRTTP